MDLGERARLTHVLAASWPTGSMDPTAAVWFARTLAPLASDANVPPSLYTLLAGPPSPSKSPLDAERMRYARELAAYAIANSSQKEGFAQLTSIVRSEQPGADAVRAAWLQHPPQDAVLVADFDAIAPLALSLQTGDLRALDGLLRIASRNAMAPKTRADALALLCQAHDSRALKLATEWLAAGDSPTARTLRIAGVFCKATLDPEHAERELLSVLSSSSTALEALRQRRWPETPATIVAVGERANGAIDLAERLEAIRALGRMRSGKAARSLAMVAASGRTREAREALRALAQFEDKAALDSLRTAIGHGLDVDVMRAYSIRRYERNESDSRLDRLVHDGTHSPDEGTRAAALALEYALDALDPTDGLRDHSARVRAVAVAALCARARTSGVLEMQGTDTDEAVRTIALCALPFAPHDRRISSQRIESYLGAGGPAGYYATATLVARGEIDLGKPNDSPFDNPVEAIREAAFVGLMQRGGDVVRLYVERLSAIEPDSWLRAAAVRELSRYNSSLARGRVDFAHTWDPSPRVREATTGTHYPHAKKAAWLAVGQPSAIAVGALVRTPDGTWPAVVDSDGQLVVFGALADTLRLVVSPVITR